MNQAARPRPTGRQLVRFAVIGAASAAAYLLLYLLLRTVTGAQVANVVALVVTQVANTATNRRFTFGLRGSQGALRHQAGGLAAFAFGLVLSAGALWLMHRIDPGAGRERMAGRADAPYDRLEDTGLDFAERVRAAYLALADAEDLPGHGAAVNVRFDRP